MPPRTLLDCDGGGQAINRLHIWLLHLVEKLPRICAEALHVLPLTLGEDRVKCQRTLSAARNPCNDNKLITRHVNIDATQVVFACTFDSNKTPFVG